MNILGAVAISVAPEVFTTAVNMKKGRAGVMLTCLCRADEREKIAEAMRCFYGKNC